MTMETREATGQPGVSVYGVAVMTLLWAGMLMGVAFLATPVKFMAPSLSLPVALDVGRQTFSVFNWVEIMAATLFLLLAVAAKYRWMIALALGAAVLVTVQSLWLLPVLDSRVEMILQGNMPPPSHLHMVYILIDGAKLLVLFAAAGLAFARI